jgi:hypothetical protein
MTCPSCAIPVRISGSETTLVRAQQAAVAQHQPQRIGRCRSKSHLKWTIEKPVSIEKRFALLGSFQHTPTSIGMV